jgi:hypothetical protein
MLRLNGNVFLREECCTNFSVNEKEGVSFAT